MSRVAAAMVSKGADITDLSAPGGTPSKQYLAIAEDCVSKLRMGPGDTVVIDL